MTYDINTVNLIASSAKVKASNFVDNQAWDLEDSYQQTLNVTNEFDEGNYAIVRVALHLRRRSLYFVYNLIFPTCIISILCLIGFILPASSGEKVVLEVTNYLAVIFFSQYVADILPKSSLGIPRISLYFGSLIIQCLISICVNIYIIRLNEENETKLPAWIDKWVCDRLAQVLKMKRPSNKVEPDEQQQQQQQQQECLVVVNAMKDFEEENKQNLSDIEKMLKLIVNQMNSIRMNAENKQTKCLLHNERKFAAAVLDRFFFYVSLVYMIVSLISFVLANRNFWLFT